MRYLKATLLVLALWAGAPKDATVGVVGECDDCSVSTGSRAKAALVITGASSVFGFLVGLASPKYAWKPSP